MYQTLKQINLMLGIQSARRSIEILKADEYDKIAITLRDLLLAKVRYQQREALKDVLRYLGRNEGKITRAELKRILKRLENVMGINLATNVDGAVLDAVTDAYQTSQNEILGLYPTFSLVDEAAIEWQHTNHLYWIGEYYHSELNEKMKSLADVVVDEGLGREEAGALFRDTLREYSQQKHYWENLSNHITTRAREFGRVSAYEYAEYEYLEVVAVLDHRTSSVCRRMDGVKIPVSRAVKLRDKMIESKDPEEIKEIDKWYTYDELKDVPDEKLPLSMSLPPYHFGCRTRTVAYTE